MSFGMGNKIEIRQRALLEAVRFCGGVTAYSQLLKVSRSRASNWINQPEIEMPYEYALLTEDITQVSIERLSPFTEAVNKLIRRLRAKDTLLPVNIALNDILMGDQSYLEWQKPDRPIIVATDGVLISGLVQVEMHKASGIKKTQVIVVDLEALILGNRCIQDIKFDFLVSERISIGLLLERLLGNHQGQRNDLRGIRENRGRNIEGNLPLRPLGDEVGRVDSYIARIVGLNSKNTYRRAKRVCLEGGFEIMNPMDCKEIPIKVAERIVRDAKSFQRNDMQTNIQKEYIA